MESGSTSRVGADRLKPDVLARLGLVAASLSVDGVREVGVLRDEPLAGGHAGVHVTGVRVAAELWRTALRLCPAEVGAAEVVAAARR